MNINRRKFLTIMGAVPIAASLPALAKTVPEVRFKVYESPSRPVNNNIWCRFSKDGKIWSGNGVSGVKKLGTGHYSVGFTDKQPDTDFTVQLTNSIVTEKKNDSVTVKSLNNMGLIDLTIFGGKTS